ncbi:hypothetical protein M422DRAFT_164830 [Sphaerobolus stellatus SS14]|uniref:Holocytochrome c-type synthase n=1 Tax=Sphaerobolus stellatus (strain SS14) TaxID=990650 RepID=A0A0C9UUU5_SPHS4|nr:hypothetical protein M422DRAFT_164830 [Sphaerobolus stellatus SS14]
MSPSVFPQCPMGASMADSDVALCPIKSDSSTLDPANNMPYLPQTRLPGQTRILPTERENSSIPRSANSFYTSTWVYPSPQQFYNALVRKGWKTPEEHVEAMVLIHNKLNEDAWADILRWEIRYGCGSTAKLELSEFAGIHGHVSNKAWLYQQLRRIFPTYFTFSLPFDRHDWIVLRPSTNRKLRYIIDYYSSRKTPWSEPQFYLDVRPAVDSVEAVMMRLHAFLGDILFPKIKDVASQRLVLYGCAFLPIIGFLLGIVPRICV